MEQRNKSTHKQELFAQVQAYLKERYIPALFSGRRNQRLYDLEPQDADWDILQRIYDRKDICERLAGAQQVETFSQLLLRILEEKQLTEPEVYNRVFMDRRLFNKIRNTPEYQPSKRTVILLAFALKLDLDETTRFMRKAGYQLIAWNKFDVIIEYFITHQNYDIFELNDVLVEFGQPPLMTCE